MAIRVVFLTFYHEAWDALDEVYRLMAEDSRFEPTVIVIPRRLTGDAGFGGTEHTSSYLTQQGIPHQLFDFEDSELGLKKLKEYAPDVVFINYPWQRNYQPAYRADRLVEFTRIAYVPYYSLPLVNEPGDIGVASHLYEQRSHQLASMVFTQDASMVAAYANTDRGNSYVHLTGTPKIDRLMRLAAEGTASWPLPGRRFRIVWAPHHSYSPAWLNFGVFAQTHLQLLRLAVMHPEIDFVLRPHPFLFGTLVDRGVLSQAAMQHWLEDWNDLTNTAIHTDGEYASLFKATDLLITDGISFLGEYPLVTGRPGIFLENPGHWEFSPLGELAAAANVRISDFDQLEQLLDSIRTEGLPDLSVEIGRLKAAASPYPGQSARRIVEIVAGNARTKLVDPATVKTIPWERREGREPLVD